MEGSVPDSKQVPGGDPMNIVEEYLALTEKKSKYAPKTKQHMIGSLRRWERFLAEHDPPIRRDRVDIGHFNEWEEAMVVEGLTEQTIVIYESHVKSFYRLVANARPESRWVRLASQLDTHEAPTVRTTASPYRPFPLEICPDILDAARDCTKAVRGYEEIYPVVAGLAYSGMRAQMYGLRVSDLDFDARVIDTRTKRGDEVQIPMHDRLVEIWKEHLENRTYESDYLFERGTNPHVYLEDRKNRGVWKEDARAMCRNQQNVMRILARVEKELRLRGIDEHLMAHRFRKTVGTWLPEFGMKEREMELILSHMAKSITRKYNLPSIQRIGRRMSQIDVWNRKWLDAHMDNGFTIGNGLNGTGDNGNIIKEVRALVNGRVLTAQEKLDMMAVIQEA